MTDAPPLPTPSTDAFAGVPAALSAALCKRGIAKLTAVQAAVVAHLGESSNGVRNLRISSQTGSGKTVALGIALARTLLDAPSGDAEGDTPATSAAPGEPRALVITPTRELANQVHGELAWLFAEAREVQVDSVTGGTDVRREQQRLRRRAPRILVGTPGRLLDHLRSGALDTSALQQVVLDEADQMLDMGFKDELDAIVERLPASRQSHLVSATFPPAVHRLAKTFQGEAIHLEGTALGQANADIEHLAYLVRPRDTGNGQNRVQIVNRFRFLHHGNDEELGIDPGGRLAT
jgi:ATP-dependent RNA helicase DeaD